MKKIILLLAAILCFSGMIYSTNFVFADKDLEIDYPTAPSDAVTPDTTKSVRRSNMDIFRWKPWNYRSSEKEND
jgi:predicted small integral membrane protein